MARNKFLQLAALLRNERRPWRELRRIQDRKLRRLVRQAYENVDLYREKMEEAGLTPDAIRSVEDLPRLPVIDKKDFQGRAPEEVLNRRLQGAVDLVTLNTSGSSGINLQFRIDRRYDAFRKAQFLRPYLTNRSGLRDRLLWLRPTPAVEKAWFRKLGFLPEYQVYAGAGVGEQIEWIRRLRPRLIRGYPSVLGQLAAHLEPRDLRGVKLKAVYADSEVLSAPMRARIEAAFGVRVIDVYGSFETENIAYECDRHEGYHVAVDCVLMEFLKAGKPVGPGEEGEVVCTVLDNHATPFIRYNLHDLAADAGRPCSCGRTFPLMTKITGRSHEYARKANGSKISGTSLTAHLWPLTRELLEFQVIQEEIDRFRVCLVPSPHFDLSCEERIRQAIHLDFPEARVEVDCVETIARGPAGKFKEFRSMLSDRGEA